MELAVIAARIEATASSERSRTRILGSKPVSAIIFWEECRPTPKIRVRPISNRSLSGILTPAMLAMLVFLPLSLFVVRVCT